jgi:hypothetical protein
MYILVAEQESNNILRVRPRRREVFLRVVGMRVWAGICRLTIWSIGGMLCTL